MKQNIDNEEKLSKRLKETERAFMVRTYKRVIQTVLKELLKAVNLK